MSFVPVLTDYAGNQRSELAGAFGKGISIAVGTMGTSRVTVRLDHPDADFLLGGAALVKWYEVDDDYLKDGSRTLHAHHRLVTAEEVANNDQQTVACTFADPFWVLMRRLIIVGAVAAGYSLGTPAAPVDIGAIITNILSVVNAIAPTGVRIGNVTPSATSYAAYTPLKIAGQAIAELGASLGGPDWRVRPVDYAATSNPATGIIGELDVAAAIGSVRKDAVFEYGDGLLNVENYKRAVTLDGLATTVYTALQGSLDDIRSASAPASAINTWGYLEDVVATDLTVTDLRDKLLAAHIAARQAPRQLITFTPSIAIGTRIPRYGRDYGIGDTVPFRASAYTRQKTDSVPALTKRIDVLTRVYGLDIAVDDEGAPTPTLTTVPV